jgi:hypothetical protein
VPICEVCGNEYDKPFQVWRNGRLMIFDKVECAIEVMRPGCADCGCAVIGHGVEVDGEIVCSPGCAAQGRVSANKLK